MSEPKPNKKRFNKIFVIIPVIVVATLIIVFTITSDNPIQIADSQQCNDAINNYLDILEPRVESSSSMSEFEQAMYQSGNNFDEIMFEIDGLCGNHGSDDIMNNSNLDTYTKNRLSDAFSKLDQLELSSTEIP